MLQRRQFLSAATLLASGSAFAQDRDFWSLLREGANVVLMRHARTEPGVGDPPGFRLGECGTQRNLSAEGREQARRVGEAFRREGIRLDEVRSSAWCRCIDTAQLAFGRHTVWAPVNSFFDGAGERDAQTRAVLAALRGLRAPANWMLVTHQVNITALTGENPAMGEVFVARPEADGQRLRVLARQAF
ncbi:MAG: histidine phosphatase family protein [Hydrogenophaga sp.]|uniref:Histidine phosphatase family protein n=1 Tax=Hydrogenophaga crocea TaxID=2716225 RepID=A0A6G8IDP7_9BURK|nr:MULTISPECIES: histidine phosphatase family protein [Hydrogenophaga]MBL0942818.1 histidine phosphatase family protein [Hydrogenophaga sp.]QIM51120.1 histidine phosphatase family protein [Hydrogenophaga crocea]